MKGTVTEALRDWRATESTSDVTEVYTAIVLSTGDRKIGGYIVNEKVSAGAPRWHSYA